MDRLEIFRGGNLNPDFFRSRTRYTDLRGFVEDSCRHHGTMADAILLMYPEEGRDPAVVAKEWDRLAQLLSLTGLPRLLHRHENQYCWYSAAAGKDGVLEVVRDPWGHVEPDCLEECKAENVSVPDLAFPPGY